MVNIPNATEESSTQDTCEVAALQPSLFNVYRFGLNSDGSEGAVTDVHSYSSSWSMAKVLVSQGYWTSYHSLQWYRCHLTHSSGLNEA